MTDTPLPKRLSHEVKPQPCIVLPLLTGSTMFWPQLRLQTVHDRIYIRSSNQTFPGVFILDCFFRTISLRMGTVQRLTKARPESDTCRVELKMVWNVAKAMDKSASSPRQTKTELPECSLPIQLQLMILVSAPETPSYPPISSSMTVVKVAICSDFQRFIWRLGCMSDSALRVYGLQQRFSEMMGGSRGQFKLDSSLLFVPSRINTPWCLWQTMTWLANVGEFASGIGSCRSGNALKGVWNLWTMSGSALAFG